jgi:hypothetical protein
MTSGASDECDERAEDDRHVHDDHPAVEAEDDRGGIVGGLRGRRHREAQQPFQLADDARLERVEKESGAAVGRGFPGNEALTSMGPVWAG